MTASVVTHRVLYVDTDQMKVVNHATYLRWFESARNEMLRAIGFPYASLEEQGYMLPVVELACRYLLPARYDDVIKVESRLVELKRATVAIEYRIRLAERASTPGMNHPVAIGALLVAGQTVHACVDRGGRVRRLPDDVRARLADQLMADS